MTSPQTFAAHNIDAIVAAVAVPVFLLAGLPLEGWFWATALWAVNRYAQAVVERRAARASALRGAGIMGASMLVRPWIGMLVLFLITKDDRTLMVSSVLFFLLLITIDIATRVFTHKNIRGTLGGAA
jgi:cytochrome c oxidase assembly factor CtaG